MSIKNLIKGARQGISVPLAIVTLLVVGGCTSTPTYTAPTAPPALLTPGVTISSPADGASLTAGNVAVAAQVTNFKVVDKQGQTNVSGEGHLHFYLDVSAPTAPGAPAVPPSGVWAHVSGTTYTFTNVAAGTHTLSVQLVNNNHTPVTTIVVATIHITVTITGGGGDGSSYY